MYNYGYGYGPMMGGYGGAGDIFGHILGFIIMVAVVLFVLRMIFGRRHWRMRHMGQNNFGGFGGFGHTAIDTLKERYAKGEIDKAEFEEKKKVLMEDK